MSSSNSSSRSVSPSSSVASTDSTPLLDCETSDPAPSNEPHYGRSAFFIWVTILCIILTLTATNGLIQAPQQRILESVFCKYYFQEHDPSKIGLDGEVPEIWCKIPEVHRPLASLRGWYDSVSSLPGRFTTWRSENSI